MTSRYGKNITVIIIINNNSLATDRGLFSHVLKKNLSSHFVTMAVGKTLLAGF